MFKKGDMLLEAHVDDLYAAGSADQLRMLAEWLKEHVEVKKDIFASGQVGVYNESDVW